MEYHYEYVRVQSPEDATHWIPTQDDRFKIHSDLKVKLFGFLAKFSRKCDYAYNLMTMHNDPLVTIGKKYQIFVNPQTEELDIIDDRNNRGELWLVHKGYFVKRVD